MESVITPILTGEVARLLGLSCEMVRFLERTGQLSATRTTRGVRLFDRGDVERLARERQGRRSAGRTGIDTTPETAVG